jgi:hypothetical protein
LSVATPEATLPKPSFVPELPFSAKAGKAAMVALAATISKPNNTTTLMRLKGYTSY